MYVLVLKSADKKKNKNISGNIFSILGYCQCSSYFFSELWLCAFV